MEQQIVSAINTFNLNIESVKQLQLIHEYLEINAIPNLDLSELLRAEIALAVSALDCFIHDLVRLATLEIYDGLRPFGTHAYKLPLESRALINLLTKDKDEQLATVDREIRKTNKTLSFQNPDKIETALLQVGIENIWTKVAGLLENRLDAMEVKNQLEIIIAKRNTIIHEGDVDEFGNKYVMDKTLVATQIRFIEKICTIIYAILTTP